MIGRRSFAIAGASLLLPGFARAQEQRLHRIYVYGASHTASDQFTSVLRAALRTQRGNGGAGYFMPAAPFPFYEHAFADFERRSGFEGCFVRYRERRRDDYGISGFALEARDGARARMRFDESIEGQRLTFMYRSETGAGSVTISLGATRVNIDCAGRTGTRLVQVLEAAPDERTFEVHVRGEVRIFGFALEHDDGVVVDNFGVPGTTAADQLRWRDASLRAALLARPAELVLLAYGTNESARRAQGDEAADLARVVERVRRCLPRAEIALIGPGEWPRHRRGQWVSRPRTLEVIRTQRAVARAKGLRYFDTYAWMGGEGSMRHFVEEGLAIGDHVHFTDEGYARLGRAVAAWL